MKRWMRGLAVVLWASALAGCSLYRNDRQYLYDVEYQNIRDIYDKCGSVAVVEQVLRERQWTRAQINEAKYRLAQDFSLDEKGQPRGIDRPRPIVKSKGPDKMGLGNMSGPAPRLGSNY